MLKSVTVDNFKSLINLTFEPTGLNLLLGSNNAGKTNLCHALRFLNLSSQMPLDNAAYACTAEPWNLLNVYIQKDSLNFSLTCDLKFEEEVLLFSYELSILSHKGQRLPTTRTFSVFNETLKASGGKFQDTTLLENNRGKVRLLHESRFLKSLTSGSEAIYIETDAPLDTTMLFRLYDLESNPRSNLFKRYLGSWGYYSFDPLSLRSKMARQNDQVLDSRGGNLSSVMYTLHNANPRVEKKILDAVKDLEPHLDLLSFQAPDPEHVYMFFEDGRGNKFGVDNVSDGTLRYLAMCYLIITGRRGVTDRAVAPVIIIEEPENGIFVGYLKNLFEKIDLSGKDGQFIFTSHNPYFIDLFDAALNGLFLMKSGDTHSTLVEPDPAKLADRLGKFSLGEMHFRSLLE